MRSRLTLPRLDGLDPQQRKVYETVLRTRGNVDGPFLAWMLNPALAEPAQALGAFCRFGTSLSLRESELVILLVAAEYRCAGEQQIHEPIAARQGWTPQVIADIRAGKEPVLPDGRTHLLFVCVQELLHAKTLNGATYALAVAALGEKALVELVAVVGYYAFVAFTLNAFEMTPGGPAT